MSFVCIRGSDDAVIGHTSMSSSPQSPDYEIEESPTPEFVPSFTKIKWTYDGTPGNYTNTGLPMDWP